LAVATAVHADIAETRDAKLRAYLRQGASPDPAVRYHAAWADLNDDGRPEVLLYAQSRDDCGSGGCSLEILEPTASGFRSLRSILVTRLPIGVLPGKHHGWHDLTVRVGGGGLVAGYVAVVPYVGWSYAFNPTSAPAHPIASGVDPKILIAADDPGFVLDAPGTP